VRRAAALLITLLPLAGCEESPGVPPLTSRAAEIPVEVDHLHAATLHADRQIVVPNLVFVVQRSSTEAGVVGLTLLTSRPGPDGSRLVFGTSQNLAGPDRLTGLKLQFGGRSLFDPSGNGVFTVTVAYQPKFASITITKVLDTEVSGTISGEFHRFRALHGKNHADVIQVEGTFRAALVLR